MVAVTAHDAPPEPPRPARGEMRERILDVALELFVEQGYDRTSLREIAERLGVTKAALYYHFERKADILLELHLRLHALGTAILQQIDRLDDQREAYALWPGLLDQFIDSVLANTQLFLLHQRNRSAFETLLDNERHRAENDDLEQRYRRFLANATVPLDQRVRMACSVAAVLGVLMSSGGVFGDASTVEVAEMVREAAADLLSLRRARGRG